MRITKLWMALAIVCGPTPMASAAAAVTPIHAVRQPDYAKAGQAAVLAAKQRYSAEVVDYAFEGRNSAGNGLTEFRFRLWLQKDGRQFGVRVTVRVNASSGEPTGMSWTEIKP